MGRCSKLVTVAIERKKWSQGETEKDGDTHENPDVGKKTKDRKIHSEKYQLISFKFELKTNLTVACPINAK